MDTISTETVCRSLNKTAYNRGLRSAGAFSPKRMPIVSMPWKMFGMLTVGSMMITRFWSVSMRSQGNRHWKPVCPDRFVRVNRRATMTNRNGTGHLCMLSAPRIGWRHVKATDRRTKQDLTHVLKDLADGHCSEKNLVVVMDTLNTHKRSTLYGTFKLIEARRLTRRFEVHHTLKHGSWLNMALVMRRW